MSALVAKAIAEHREEILDNWIERVSKRSRARSLPREVIQNNVPKLLDDIVQALRRQDALHASEAIPTGAAAMHGEYRLELGYTLSELGNEYNSLRQAILDALDAAGVALNNQTAAALHSAIDQAHRIGVERFIELGQQRLQQRQSDFLAQLAHDLRSPLTTILASAQLAKRGVPGGAPQQLSHLSRIERAARQVLLLVEGQLATEEALAGKLRIRLEDVELNSLVESVVDALRRRAEDKNLDIQVLVPAGLVFKTDRLLLGQVLQNLLDNAIKYSEHGVIRISSAPDDRGVTLSVTDQGRGIPKEFVPNLFQMYRRAEHATNGHGIGLAVVETFVNALGGRLNVQSEVGRGSRFEVWLPVVTSLSQSEVVQLL